MRISREWRLATIAARLTDAIKALADRTKWAAQGNQKAQAGLFGGLLSGAGSALAAMSQGGVVPGYADGGEMPSAEASVPQVT